MKTIFYSCVLISLLSTSCVSSKKAIYFNNIADTSFARPSDVPEAAIQSNDLLSITVSSLNPEASVIFNTPNLSTPTASLSVSASAAVAASGPITGYLVNKQGKIKFPMLGSITAAGLTNKQLEDTITSILTRRELLVEPIVNVRVTNFKVTVLGEVAKPTVINVQNEKISILEALGMAGDLTIFAKRDNVLLVREENGKKTTKRINLNSKEVLSSPYYYLKTNDVVYVEPNNAKISSTTNARQLLPTILGALSVISIILTRK